MENILLPVVKPILVKPLLLDEQEALRRHGCAISPFPRKRPDILKGHMVTFPDGTEMEDTDGVQYTVYFPSEYKATLIWSENWYHLYPERGENGSLI